jgi:hypothetical protein
MVKDIKYGAIIQGEEGGLARLGKDPTLSPTGGLGSRRSSACAKPPVGDKPSASEGKESRHCEYSFKVSRQGE